MLADFQQALADVVADPQLCLALRRDPQALRSRYALSEREWARLLGMAGHEGMSAACTVYRMNRLSPLAMNLHDTLHALGPTLGEVLADYWREHARGIPHFQLESQRFCAFLQQRIDAGTPMPAGLSEALVRDSAAVEAALQATRG